MGSLTVSSVNPQLLNGKARSTQPNLKFGKIFQNGGQIQGAYLDPEPVSHGGLGKIGQELPLVFKDELGIPLMKISPLLNPMKKDLNHGRRLTGFMIKDWKGNDAPVDVYELPPDNGVRRIVLVNDAHFGQFDNLTSDTNVYQSKKTAAKALGDDAGVKAYVFFSKAAAELLSHHQSALGRKVDFVVANDWMTSAALNELDPKVAKDLKKIYFFHNHYDEPRRKTFFEKLGLKIPNGVQKRYQVSLAALGLANADAIIINRHYRDSLTKTELAQGHVFLPTLEAQAAKTVDMHHGILEIDNPRKVNGLREEGFTQLRDPATPQELARFKAQNKQALQKLFKLKEDPEAVVFSFVSRFDPRQKGFGLISDNVKAFLKENPKAQMVLCGIDALPSVELDLISLMKSPELKGRLHYTTERLSLSRRHQVMAGSDFFMMPSLYEPFGLGQLEAMKMGTLPVVTDVDGLKSTSSDPERNTGEKETAWNYGQVAVKAKPFNVPGYRRAFEKSENPPELSDVEEKLMQITEEVVKANGSNDGNGWYKKLMGLREDVLKQKVFTEADQKALDEAKGTYLESLNRAMALAKDSKKFNEARSKAIEYVDKEHTWGAIAKRYYQPFFKKLFPFLDEATKKT